MGIGDWGLGIGDWGLGPIPNPQSPIPNPQSPIPIEKKEKERIKHYEDESEMSKQILTEEPDEKNKDACCIKFKYPSGDKEKERRFLKTEKVDILYSYIKSIGREIFFEQDATDFDLMSGFPPKNLENSKNKTLEEEGLYPNSVIQIKEK